MIIQGYLKITVLFTFLFLFIRPSSGIVRTEEIGEWNKETLSNYFQKYKILYDKTIDHRSLSEIAQSYKDSAAENTKYFGEQVDRIIQEFSGQIQKQNGLVRNDIQSFFNNLKHKLRKLELKGQLSKEQIETVLDQAHTEAVKAKIMTESQWEKAYRVFKNRYQPPAWYQRVLGVVQKDDSSFSFNRWMQTVTDHVTHLGGVTKEQAKTIHEEIRQGISNTDIHQLGDSAWLEELSHSISSKTQLKKDQLDNIMKTISQDIHGYKIFGLEYTGQAKEKAKNTYERIKYQIQDGWSQLTRYLKHTWSRLNRYLQKHNLNQPKEEIIHATDSVKSVASSLSSDWHSSSKSMARSRTIHSVLSKASKAAIQATQKIQDLEHFDIKDTFGHFWRQKEHDYYRRLGYTEAHIDWIQDFLVKTFKNQKKSVRDSIDDAAQTIQHYLNSLKIQSPVQNDQNIHKIKRQLESWRTLVI